NHADFFSITIDQQGAAEIVYDDTSNGLVQPGFTPTGNQTVDHAGAPLVTVARQSSGPGLFGTAVSGPSSSPVTSLADPRGDALYPVLGGTNVPGLDVLQSSISQSGQTLTVTMQVADVSKPALTVAAVPGATLLQYVTRWQLGNTIFYAAMSDDAAGQPLFYAGKAQSVDLCSVSACFPHVLTYPEPGLGGTAETGRVSSPAAGSLLEEAGAYAFASSHPQGATTNAQALADH